MRSHEVVMLLMLMFLAAFIIVGTNRQTRCNELAVEACNDSLSCYETMEAKCMTRLWGDF